MGQRCCSVKKDETKDIPASTRTSKKSKKNIMASTDSMAIGGTMDYDPGSLGGE